MIEEHLDGILDSIDTLLHTGDCAITEFRYLLETLFHQSKSSRQRNIVAMSEAKYLPPKLLTKLKHKELQVLKSIQECLERLNPQLDKHLYTPYAFLSTGIVNWTDNWFDDEGTLSREDLIYRVSDLFLHGFLEQKK